MATELTAEQRLDRLEDALTAYVLMNHVNPALLVNNPANAQHGQVVLDFVRAIGSERR